MYTSDILVITESMLSDRNCLKVKVGTLSQIVIWAKRNAAPAKSSRAKTTTRRAAVWTMQVTK